MRLILLTYKRKLLLKRKDNCSTLTNKNLWSFFENVDGSKKNNKVTIVQEVEEEMNIAVNTMTLLASTSDNVLRNKYYFACLTDKNVNDIQRHNGQELQFFAMKEIEKLSLTDSSKMFFLEYKTMIESSFESQ